MIDEFQDVVVQRKVLRDVEVLQIQKVQKFAGVPVTRQAEQIAQVPKVEVIDEIKDVAVQRKVLRNVEVPQAQKVQGVLHVPVTRQGEQIAQAPKVEVINEIKDVVVQRNVLRSVVSTHWPLGHMGQGAGCHTCNPGAGGSRPSYALIELNVGELAVRKPWP